MVTIFIGSGAVWGLIAAMTGGNWKAGLLVALLVFFFAVSGMRARAAAEADQGEWVMVRREPEPKRGWF
jgi:hypothetical protein